MSKKLGLAGLAVLLVAASALVTLAIVRSSMEQESTPNSAPTMRVAVVGDSYTSGLGNTIVWTSLFANSSTFSVGNFAAPGSGYVGGAGESGPFSSQLDKVMATKPDVILVFGGINDVGKSSELIQQAAMDLFAELARRAPTAQIIVLGPIWHEDPPPPEALAIDTAVQAAADASRTAYIRLIDELWLVGPDLIQADGIHPTDEGQSIMARELGPILTQRIRVRSKRIRSLVMSFLGRLRSKRLSTIAVAVGAAVTAGAVGAAVIGIGPSWAPAPAAASDQSSQSEVALKPARSALFVGDSYTAGPSSMAEFGYPCVASTILGWECNLGAQPATGYISGGPGHRLGKVLGALEQTSTSLSERFLRLRETDKADIVVLDAGRNDLQYGPEYLRNMFVYTIRRAKESWPNARIVVIAPWFIDRPNVEVPGVPGLTVGNYLDETLRSFPEFNDVVFIDPGALGWFTNMDPAPYIGADGIHPNIAGHKLIGQLLAEALEANGLAATE